MSTLSLTRTAPTLLTRWAARIAESLQRRSRQATEHDQLQALLSLDERTLRDIGVPEWTVQRAAAAREASEQGLRELLGGRVARGIDAARA
jgi:hypothetical protein